MFSFRFPNHFQRPNSTHVPSPGTYSPQFNLPTQKCIFSKSKRDISYLSNRPGPSPGEYSPTSPHCRSPSYTLGSRFRHSAGSSSPSPTTYRIPSGHVTPLWSFSHSSRPGIIAGASTVPGPGDYEIRTNSQGPAYSMKSRCTSSGNSLSPGPATYGGLYTQFD